MWVVSVWSHTIQPTHLPPNVHTHLPRRSFALYLQEKEEAEQRPVFTEEGFTYVYVKYNNLYLLSVTKRNANVALMLVYLYRLVDVFKVRLGYIIDDYLIVCFVRVDSAPSLPVSSSKKPTKPKINTHNTPGLLRGAGGGEHPGQLRHHLRADGRDHGLRLPADHRGQDITVRTPPPLPAACLAAWLSLALLKPNHRLTEHTSKTTPPKPTTGSTSRRKGTGWRWPRGRPWR